MNDAKSKYKGATTLAGVSIAAAMVIRHPTVRIIAWILAGIVSLLALGVMIHTYDRFSQLTQEESAPNRLWVNTLMGVLIFLAILIPKMVNSVWRGVVYGALIITILRLPLLKRKEKSNAPDHQVQKKRRTK